MFHLKLKSDSDDCKFEIDAVVSFKDKQNKLMMLGYFLFIIIIYSLNLFGCHTVIEKIKQDTNNAMKFSLLIVELTVT